MRLPGLVLLLLAGSLGALSAQETEVGEFGAVTRQDIVEEDLGFELPGRILTLAVDDGQAVAAGDTLARLDVAAMRADRRRLEAQRDEAAAVLDEMRAGPRKEVRDGQVDCCCTGAAGGAGVYRPGGGRQGTGAQDSISFQFDMVNALNV